MVHSSQQQEPQPSHDMGTDLPEGDRPTPEHVPDLVAVRRDMHDRLARIMVRSEAA